jgi:P-loop containing dynein motor region D4
MYPGLVNCTTIDWFQLWPADALIEVATKFISDVPMDDESHRGKISAVFSGMHTSVVTASGKMLEEVSAWRAYCSLCNCSFCNYSFCNSSLCSMLNCSANASAMQSEHQNSSGIKPVHRVGSDRSSEFCSSTVGVHAKC